MDDTFFEKYRKVNRNFKNRQTDDKSLTFTVNYNEVKAKIGIIDTNNKEQMVNAILATHVLTSIIQVTTVWKNALTHNKLLNSVVNSDDTKIL